MAALALPSGAMADTHLLEGYRAIELPKIDLSSQTPFALADDFLSLVGATVGDSKISLIVEQTAQGYVFDFKLREYLDDSLAGENYRVIVQQHGARYYVSDAGVQYLCARGKNTTTPQAEYCP
ncbi:hypothetical protein KX928_08420 [Roseobacter sp. YSTF-M11]|uniref:Uncharacterized protein n=1 Tax=Roseobacter insulae TaxID=2859783 RepID=A0A9X1FUA8_9RHOB|nr:hypothetical protein [Roseobacter insulae]MBW4707808.1 hypothetical protein [Roseobacter insulae]